MEQSCLYVDAAGLRIDKDSLLIACSNVGGVFACIGGGVVKLLRKLMLYWLL